MAAPYALPNLYCQPADIWNYLGTEGVDLRLDDHNLATGQTIAVSANAAAGATSLSVNALLYSLLNGATLEFDGGGTQEVVQVQLTAAANQGATTLTVAPLPFAINAQAQAQDNGVNLATGARLAVASIRGTAKVKLYCSNRYDDSQLVLSNSVNEWATIYGSRWLTTRRGQSPPVGIERDWEEALEEMKLVQKGELYIEDIGTRSNCWPFISNQTIDPNYDVIKARVETQLSEATPTNYPQFVDWQSIFTIEY